MIDFANFQATAALNTLARQQQVTDNLNPDPSQASKEGISLAVERFFQNLSLESLINHQTLWNEFIDDSWHPGAANRILRELALLREHQIALRGANLSGNSLAKADLNQYIVDVVSQALEQRLEPTETRAYQSAAKVQSTNSHSIQQPANPQEVYEFEMNF